MKVLFLAFLGIHIPLFAIIAYLVTTSLPKEEAWTLGILTLIFTLIATAVTLFLLNKLLKPLIQAKNALNNTSISPR